VALDGAKTDELNEVIHKMAADGLRTIGLGYRDFEKAQNWEKEDEIETSLTLVAIVGIRVSNLTNIILNSLVSYLTIY